MARYRHRRIYVTAWGHSQRGLDARERRLEFWYESSAVGFVTSRRQPKHTAPLRTLKIMDSAEDQSILVPDENGEDLYAFMQRAAKAVLEYLDRLGAAGWRLVQFVPEAETEAGVPYRTNWPIGTHLLVLEEP